MIRENFYLIEFLAGFIPMCFIFVHCYNCVIKSNKRHNELENDIKKIELENELERKKRWNEVTRKVNLIREKVSKNHL